MPTSFRITPSPTPPAQRQRPAPTTPTEVEARSSGRSLRPVEDIIREVRQRDGDAPLSWPAVLGKLPAKFG